MNASRSETDVLVIGGGVSGLAAAWRLRRAGVDLRLIEASDTVGGCTRTDASDGFLLEQGPFNVMVRDPSFQRLLVELSDRVRVVSADRAARKRFIYRRGQLLQVPTNPIRLLTTPLLSPGARLRLIAGLIASRRPGDAEETIEQAAARRFGPEVADTMVSAVISGVLAGDTRRLSLSGCFPGAGKVDGSARSLIGYGLTSALRSKRHQKRPRRKWRGLVSIDGGLGALTGALGATLGDDLLTAHRTEAIRAFDGGFEADCRDADGRVRTFVCRRLVMALPVTGAAALLDPTLPEAATIMRSIESASLAVLNLGYRREDIAHPMDGFGFLVPHNEREFPLMGVLWADSVFPHHAPHGHRLLRVFIGGAGHPDALSRDDDDLVRTATNALRDPLDIRGAPMLVNVCRHTNAIPQYHLGHRAKIARIRERVASSPGLHLIGNYLDGVSLNDCVRLATQTAESLINENAPSREVACTDDRAAVFTPPGLKSAARPPPQIDNLR